MSRQLRIEYPGAFYHVYSRGNQKYPIFFSDEDRYYFLKTLREANEKFELVIQAYCLMPNHYHLSLGTPSSGISKGMHLINTSYSVYLNKKHGRCGHLFQGRFRSVLVEAQSYSYELSRYIHLNPVRAGLADGPGDYPWSSYMDYIGIRRPPSWLDTRTILGTGREEDVKAYESYVLAGIGQSPPQGYDESKRSGILGGPDFIDKIRQRAFKRSPIGQDRELSQLRVFRERASLGDLYEQSLRALGPKNRLLKSVAIYVSHRKADYTLQEIADFYGMSVSGISNARKRVEKELVENATLFRIIQEISASLKEAR
jgi:REP element-mobilizing transposase RayT/predicted DNA-binding protein YlxM (UPF0122 family)